MIGFKGCPASSSNDAIYKAFLNTTRRLTEIHKTKIADMCRLVGISVISALKKAAKDVTLPPSSVEPKFRHVFIFCFNRQR